MTKNWGLKKIPKTFSRNLQRATTHLQLQTKATDVRRTSVLAFEPLFA